MRRRQYIVSVEANDPFSQSLFTGGPPPHSGKYSHDAMHCVTPSRIDEETSKKAGLAETVANESLRTSPNVKSPYTGCRLASSSGENVETRPELSKLRTSNGVLVCAPTVARSASTDPR